jgi:hypothetical protein
MWTCFVLFRLSDGEWPVGLGHNTTQHCAQYTNTQTQHLPGSTASKALQHVLCGRHYEHWEPSVAADNGVYTQSTAVLGSTQPI